MIIVITPISIRIRIKNQNKIFAIILFGYFIRQVTIEIIEIKIQSKNQSCRLNIPMMPIKNKVIHSIEPILSLALFWRISSFVNITFSLVNGNLHFGQ